MNYHLPHYSGSWPWKRTTTTSTIWSRGASRWEFSFGRDEKTVKGWDRYLQWMSDQCLAHYEDSREGGQKRIDVYDVWVIWSHSSVFNFWCNFVSSQFWSLLLSWPVVTLFCRLALPSFLLFPLPPSLLIKLMNGICNLLSGLRWKVTDSDIRVNTEVRCEEVEFDNLTGVT